MYTVAAWEIAHLGSCHWENYPWEVASWEKAYGKVPNIIINNIYMNPVLLSKYISQYRNLNAMSYEKFHNNYKVLSLTTLGGKNCV